jgi:TatA/E family protein of Tat protein translocase
MSALVLAFGLPSGAEWIIILVIALLIFGPKLPSIMRGLGGSIKEFKKGMNTDETPAAPPAPPQPPAGAVSRDPAPPAAPGQNPPSAPGQNPPSAPR